MICENESGNKYIYTYRAYELNIKSDIFLPELLTFENKEYANVDVLISYGTMPFNIRQEIQEGKKYHFEKKEMWFSIKNVAIYYIYNGNTIIVEPYENCNIDHLKLFIHGSAFGMLLLQRSIIAIHGSSIVIDGKAVILTGNSGAGKSTLSIALRERGYTFLSDDISAVQKNREGSLVVKPGFPQQKLCKDVMERMGYNTKKFNKVNDDRDKYVVPVYNDFLKEAVTLRAVFELSVADVKEVEIIKINGSSRLITLLKNIYISDVTRFSGMEENYFRMCVEISKNVTFYKILRPKDSFSVVQQIEKIIEIIQQKQVVEDI